jgi:L-lactate dehydrogenase complex protein LldG
MPPRRPTAPRGLTASSWPATRRRAPRPNSTGWPGVVTGCAVAIAETGTIILDHGPGQGRRALTLVPDFHLVVVRADQVAADLADAFAWLDPARPHILISGPSATSGIELIRVEGVHGPRNLHILLVSP